MFDCVKQAGRFLAIAFVALHFMQTIITHCYSYEYPWVKKAVKSIIAFLYDYKYKEGWWRLDIVLQGKTYNQLNESTYFNFWLWILKKLLSETIIKMNMNFCKALFIPVEEKFLIVTWKKYLEHHRQRLKIKDLLFMLDNEIHYYLSSIHTTVLFRIFFIELTNLCSHLTLPCY